MNEQLPDVELIRALQGWVDRDGQTVPLARRAIGEIQRLREDLRRTESAHAVVMAENTHYKAEVARLTSIIRGKTFVTDDKAAQPPGDG